ncbi:hypothetical protein TSAR_000937 [Trichomalopsis sarcophagae]|uniref:Uncharacterized protein n=1 Tax=Trichomalopsis sarcophagae TaxID=543379 RepID=A0A232EF10_9HYME|nr:hypothetical protein TSAR_000937 [Trichomalopsis sarcophagae]
MGFSSKPTTKRPRNKSERLCTIDFIKHLEPAKNFVLFNLGKFPFNHDKLVAFLESVRIDIYPHIKDRGTKSRITRIRNILNTTDTNKVITYSKDSDLSDSEKLK